jgi:hypothetical protein
MFNFIKRLLGIIKPIKEEQMTKAIDKMNPRGPGRYPYWWR